MSANYVVLGKCLPGLPTINGGPARTTGVLLDPKQFVHVYFSGHI